MTITPALPVGRRQVAGILVVQHAVVIDLYSRTVVGWARETHPTAEFVVDAVNMTVWRRKPTGPVIHHSDQGAQFTSLVFTRRLKEAGIWGSMGSVGDARHKAVAGIFRHFARFRSSRSVNAAP